MTAHDLEGWRSVVVGGSSGIGLAVARLVLERGGSAVVVGRRRDRLDDAAASLGGGERLGTASVDLTDETSVRAFAEGMEPGSVDALVISASSVAHGAFATMPTDDLRGMIEAKLVGPFVVIREMLPALRRPGASVTLFSGVLSRRPGSNGSGLAAVNAAVEGLTRALARELAPDIRVNCIAPGMTRTDAYAGMGEAAREAMFAAVAEGLPLGRVAEPATIAQAVLFAATNDFMTGHVLDVDGGHVIA